MPRLPINMRPADPAGAYKSPTAEERRLYEMHLPCDAVIRKTASPLFFYAWDGGGNGNPMWTGDIKSAMPFSAQGLRIKRVMNLLEKRGHSVKIQEANFSDHTTETKP